LSQQITGTLPYMAPEQLRGEPADRRTDIWAAGAVLYELATGARPFPETHGPLLINAILNQEPEPPRKRNSEISPGLESVIWKALRKNPADRYQSAGELEQDLRRLTAGVSPQTSGPATTSRRRLLLAVALLVVSAGFTAGYFLLKHTSRLGEAHIPSNRSVGSSVSSSPPNTRKSIAMARLKNLSSGLKPHGFPPRSRNATSELAAGEKLLTISGRTSRG
jgi:serine/threonine-protein kinase